MSKKILYITAPLTLLLLVCSISIYSNFHPDRVHEMTGHNRVIAKAIDSSDETIHVLAADWPHTFWRPFFLGESEWPERYDSAKFYKSNDGTIIAFLAKEHNAKNALYVAAYDFKNHSGYESSSISQPSVLHAIIVELLEQREGREENPIEIPSLNSGLYTH